MSLTILSVAYPLAPVGPDAVGGAEQVLTQMDRALVAAGHRSIVVAEEGSRTAGTLFPTPVQTGIIDGSAKKRAWTSHREAIAAALGRWRIDLVHLHGVDFAEYLPPGDVPALITLHLPVSWYGADALHPKRPNTWLNCVGRAQHEACATSERLLPPIGNGVPIDALTARHAKRPFALVLGRICPEKGVHLALEAATRSGTAVVVAGEVFPYEAHQRYFAGEVRPRLDAKRRFIGPVGFARKRRLLTAARCLIVASTAPETSSLVAREALACGTPVVGFRNGALPEVIEHGRTGFLADTVDELAEAIRLAARLDANVCRTAARERFSLEAMTRSYLDVYRRLARETGRISLPGAA